MESKAVVKDQPLRGGGVKQKNRQVDGKNRRALGDIGNLVTASVVDSKPQIRISRPITRSFGAQLLAKAQAAADKNNKPLAEVVNGVVAGKNRVGTKAVTGAQKNVTLKQKTETVKVISPDDERVVMTKSPLSGKKTKKTGKSLTSDLQKPLAEVVNGVVAGKNRVGTKAVTGAQKNVTLKQKTETVKVLSPDDERVVMTKSPLSGKKTKKTGKSLTSVLTARSKVACGIAKKPKEKIVEIDAKDADNELAATEYVEDIYKFYKLTESDGQVNDYIGSQPEISSTKRAILVDWLIEVHEKFELMPESLYLTINIMDRFLSKKTVPSRELQLVGISSMLIACKYEEIWAPQVSDFMAISDNAYVRELILFMEKSILGTLEWYLTIPTPYVFLVRYIKAAVPSDKEIKNMAFFLAELGLLNYSTIIDYCPSKLAASAVYAARCTLNVTPPWTATLKYHTGYPENQIIDCAKLLAGFHSSVPESRLKAVCRKYSNPERGAVALFPPATSLLPAPSS